MKQLMILAAAVAMLTLATGAFAQIPVDAEDGDVGVFGDALGLSTAIQAVPLTPFDYFVVAFNLGDIFGYELSVIQPPEVTVLGRTPLPPTALDVGPGEDNWIVGTGNCLPGEGPQALITMSGLIFADLADGLVCIDKASPSTPALGGGPGWLHCDETLAPFGIAESGEGRYPDACGVINPTLEPPVSNDAQSFGSLKASFGE